MTKAPAKFQNDPCTTVGGVASTRYLLSGERITDLPNYGKPNTPEKAFFMAESYKLYFFHSGYFDNRVRLKLGGVCSLAKYMRLNKPTLRVSFFMWHLFPKAIF